jgi:Fic family protein
MLYLSAYFERRRAEYTDLMFNVSADGRWTQWINFFLNGIAAQALDSRQRMRQLRDLRGRYWERIKGARNAGNLLKLVDALFAVPIMTNNRARILLGQSIQSSSSAVARLVEEGILEPLAVPGRAGYFAAKPIFEIVDNVESAPTVTTAEATQTA